MPKAVEIQVDVAAVRLGLFDDLARAPGVTHLSIGKGARSVGALLVLLTACAHQPEAPRLASSVSCAVGYELLESGACDDSGWVASSIRGSLWRARADRR